MKHKAPITRRTSHPTGRALLLSLVAALSLCLSACQPADEGTEARTLTVTIEPLRYLTEQLAGEYFTVVSMVPAGNSPETYDPTPQQLVQLARSEAYLRIGYIGFEQVWMDKLTANAPGMRVFDTSTGIDLITVAGHSHHHHGHAAAHHAPAHTGDVAPTEVEPHVWNSPANARILARNIYQALCTLDSTHCDIYRQRLDSLNSLIDRTDSTVRALLTEAESRSFLIYHPALTYYARDYGLHQHCIEEGGKEPSPTHLQQLIRTCREERVGVIFVQQEFDTRHAAVVAHETGTRIVPINPLSYDWPGELIRTTQALLPPHEH